MSFSTPVIFIIFKRADTTQQVLARIRQVRPKQLFVIADGPRYDRIGEAEQCAATRAVIEQVDWDCDIHSNYATENLGCAKRVSSGLDWVFEQVETAIILEDDCIPDLSFFPFCETLLERYRFDDRISSICAQNLLEQPDAVYSYRFSRYQHSWGWATWRRAWQHFDFDMRHWHSGHATQLLTQTLAHPQAIRTWKKIFQDTCDGRVDSWAYRWMLACWLRESLSIHPHVNLVQNIGFGGDATHTAHAASPFAQIQSRAITFPLSHPPTVQRDAEADTAIQKLVFDTSLSEHLKNTLRDFKNRVTLNIPLFPHLKSIR